MEAGMYDCLECGRPFDTVDEKCEHEAACWGPRLSNDQIARYADVIMALRRAPAKYGNPYARRVLDFA